MVPFFSNNRDPEWVGFWFVFQNRAPFVCRVLDDELEDLKEWIKR